MRVGLVESAISHSYMTFAAKALLVELRFGYRGSVDMEHFIKKHLEKDTLLYESMKAFPTLPVLPFDSDHQKPLVTG